MRKTILIFLWTLSFLFISSFGTSLWAQNGFGKRYLGGPIPGTPQDVPPPVITNPVTPPIVLTGLTDPFTGATLSASISVDTAYGESIGVSLYGHCEHVYSASLTNQSTGGTYLANYFTDSYVSFSLHGNGYYEICISTDHGTYYGCVLVNSLPGLQVPVYTIDEGLPGEGSLDPFGHFIH